VICGNAGRFKAFVHHARSRLAAVTQVLNCLGYEHDLRLVVLGGAVCVLASAVAISLFHRARASQGPTRMRWMALDALAQVHLPDYRREVAERS